MVGAGPAASPRPHLRQQTGRQGCHDVRGDLGSVESYVRQRPQLAHPAVLCADRRGPVQRHGVGDVPPWKEVVSFPVAHPRRPPLPLVAMIFLLC